MIRLTRRGFLQAAAGGGVVALAGPQPARAITINPRDSWATNRPPKGPLSSEEVRFLLVHHSASRNGHTTSDAPAILRSFYDFHTGPEKNWNDIAYNFLIDAGGGIWEGRAGSLAGPVAGDATGGNQGYSQLVCVIGDYNTAQPTAASKASLVALLAWLADRYGVSTAPGAQVTFTSRGSNRWPAGTSVTTPTINGHRSMSKTTCPGDNLHTYVAGTLTADVDATRGGSAPPPPPPPTTTTTAPVTTTAPTTTTTAPSTTTTATPDTTTTFAATTTTELAPSTTLATTSTTAISPPTTISLPIEAAAEPPGTSSAPLGLLATAGAMVAGGAALLAWRQRRMGN